MSSERGSLAGSGHSMVPRRTTGRGASRRQPFLRRVNRNGPRAAPGGVRIHQRWAAQGSPGLPMCSYSLCWLFCVLLASHPPRRWRPEYPAYTRLESTTLVYVGTSLEVAARAGFGCLFRRIRTRSPGRRSYSCCECTTAAHERDPGPRRSFQWSRTKVAFPPFMLLPDGSLMT